MDDELDLLTIALGLLVSSYRGAPLDHWPIGHHAWWPTEGSRYSIAHRDPAEGLVRHYRVGTPEECRVAARALYPHDLDITLGMYRDIMVAVGYLRDGRWGRLFAKSPPHTFVGTTADDIRAELVLLLLNEGQR